METPNLSQRLSLKVAEGNKFINYEEIVRVEADGKHSLVYVTRLDQPVKALESFSEITDKLVTHSEFFKCHRSHIVAVNYVDKYIRKTRTLVTQKGEISIARCFVKKFEELFCK
jgi:DNA-binding LytR/AlgR family response regulator